MEKQVQDDTKHTKRFGKTLRTTIEPRKIVTNATVRTLDEMSLCFGHRVRFRNLHTLESNIITTVSVSVYVGNIWSQTLD